MLKSKTVITGAVMAVLGVLALLVPDVVQPLGLGTDPGTMIGTGLGLIFMRLGIAKNGTGV